MKKDKGDVPRFKGVAGKEEVEVMRPYRLSVMGRSWGIYDNRGTLVMGSDSTRGAKLYHFAGGIWFQICRK